LEEQVKPHVKQVNLFQVFAKSDTYEVPKYQREYAWDTEQADDLIKDLKEFSDNSDARSYLLGQTIYSSSDNPERDGCHFNVVDGQQRLISIYLLLMALRDYSKKLLQVHSKSAANESLARLDQISYVTDEETGGKNPRLVLPKFTNTFLEKISKSEALPELDINPSQRNIRENYQHFVGYLETNFSTAEELDDFTYKVLFKTLLTRVTLDSDDEALDAFEKLNSRGLPLNSADLLKNLLFQNANGGAEFDKISSQWEQTVRKMYGVWPKKAASPLYLMKSMLGERVGDGIPMPKVYKTWRKQMKDENLAPLEFSAELLAAASFTAKIGVNEVTSDTERLAASRYFKTVQHFPLVIAARKFHAAENTGALQATCMLADARVALFLLADEKANSFESGLWPIVHELSKLNPTTTSALDVYDCFDPFFGGDNKSLIEQLKFKLQGWSYLTDRDKKRQQFVLALLTHAVEKESGKLGVANSPSIYLEGRKGRSTGYDLDHIRPKKSIDELPDEEKKLHWVHGIGNLTLLHTKDNASAGSTPESEKSALYRDQDVVFTKALASSQDLESFQSHTKKVVLNLKDRGMGAVDNWSEEAAKEREAFLIELLLEHLSYEGLASKVAQLEE